MAPSQTKDKTLAIRLDPKTRFILEFVNRARGQSLTTIVERAIYEAASAVRASGEDSDYGWQDIWSDSEGTRALKIAAIKGLFPTYDEDRRLAFARWFWPFFFTNERFHTVQTAYVDVLWSRIDEFIQIRDDNVQTDSKAAPKAMAEALHKAGYEPPEWPPKTPEPSRRPSRDLDDEIPF